MPHCPHYNFTNAIAAIDPIFVANREDKFIKLEERDKINSLLFKDIICKFRKTKRIQANKERINVSWKSRVIGFGHAEQDISDADRAKYQ
jgi:hypothetical protein